MQNKSIVLASNNKGKVKEIKEIFKEYEIITLSEIEKEFKMNIDLKEDQETFKGNALQKATELYNIIGGSYLCLADDSGLCIKALNGFPGVKTARWLDADDHTKNLKILDLMRNEKNRNSSYVTAIAVVGKNIEFISEKAIYGLISNEAIGENGFGFDEIFQINNRTLAELSMEEKNKISARKKDRKSVV